MADLGTENRVYGGRYLVVEQVGSGGMATVYLGRDTVLKRDVAIKVLHPHLAGREDARARFNREAQAIARLHHPNIVDVYDYSGGADRDAYLVTEFVQGVTLTDFCEAHGPFLPQASALIAHAIAGALKHAHAQGLIHRDIKPDNLMISTAGTIKLMDFGIATAMDLEQMTATGAILGSPAHMAPEQIEGKNVDFRVDIFAFGTLLYKLVTNELPFMASNPHALFRLILESEYDPPSRYSAVIGRRFEEILSTCLARQPDDRFSSIAAVQEALDAYLRTFQMGEVAKLLPRLLKAPEQFQMEWRPVLVQVLVAEGRRQAREGSLALAINAYNRALAIDPDATEPRRGLSDLTSRSRRRKRLKSAAACVVVLAIAAGVWVGTRPPPAKAKAPPLPADAVATAALPDSRAMGEMAKRITHQIASDRAERLILRENRAKVAAAMAAAARTRASAAAANAGSGGATENATANGGSRGERGQFDGRPSSGAGRAARLRARQINDRRAARRQANGRRANGQRANGQRANGQRANGQRANGQRASRSAGGSKLIAPPEPKGLVVYTLTSEPPSATLYLDGKLITRNGVKRLPLEAGRSYTMRCEPTEACDECPAYKDVRFQVPEDTSKIIKKRILCDFSACCGRSTRPSTP